MITLHVMSISEYLPCHTSTGRDVIEFVSRVFIMIKHKIGMARDAPRPNNHDCVDMFHSRLLKIVEEKVVVQLILSITATVVIY